MTIRPSSLPMKAACPRWESSGESDIMIAGTIRHDVLRRYCKGEKDAIKELPEDEQQAIEWAAGYIEVNANSDQEQRWEQKTTWLGADFESRTGTPDLVCGADIFDFKWRQRDYTAQMADYALSQLDLFETVKVHVLFGESQRVEKLVFDRATAEGIVQPIIDQANDPDAKPTPCDYCAWCSQRLTCPALLNKAVTVAKGYSDDPKVQSWHPSDMQTGHDLAVGLWVWRKVLKPWGASIEFHAKEGAEKKGLTLPGFELKQVTGKNYIADVPTAFARAGLPQDEFLKTCAIRLNTSKRYPDQKGLIDLFKTFHGITKTAQAKREVLTKLGDAVKQGNPSIQLKAVKGDEDEESEN